MSWLNVGWFRHARDHMAGFRRQVGLPAAKNASASSTIPRELTDASFVQEFRMSPTQAEQALEIAEEMKIPMRSRTERGVRLLGSPTQIVGEESPRPRWHAPEVASRRPRLVPCRHGKEQLHLEHGHCA
jgi:hypothetical protein